jgi:methionyl aminopeptidase
MSVTIKTAEEIESMRVACRLAAEVLDFIEPHVQPGITTAELDRLCHNYMVDVQKTIPAPLNYAPPGYSPYPKSICTSVNHVVCHGVPAERALKKGDIVNLDITTIMDGFHGDTSRMFQVGEVSKQASRLCAITYECLWLGISKVRAGARLGDIGHVIQRHAESNGFSVVREFCGHGIGRKFHEDPQVLHYGKPGTGMELQAGMIFTIEPMVNAGRAAVSELSDGWTIVTRDRTLSAQWEHTVLVTPDGYEVLTVSAGSPPPPALISDLCGAA